MDYLKMSRLARDPKAVRHTAMDLLKMLDDRLTPPARKFLTELTSFDGARPLSGRNQEFFYALMQKAKGRKEMVGGYRAATLVEELYYARLDLAVDFGESAKEFIEEKYALGSFLSLTENEWKYVFVMSKRIGRIDHWVEF